jgi:hypothetical protein
MNRFPVFVFRTREELAMSGCPEMVGIKKSNKNSHQRNRWVYSGAIREGKNGNPGLRKR